MTGSCFRSPITFYRMMGKNQRLIWAHDSQGGSRLKMRAQQRAMIGWKHDGPSRGTIT